MKIRMFIFIASVLISIRLNAQDSIKFILAQTTDNKGANDIILNDFNNDGYIDAFIVNGTWNKPLPSKLWINDGTGHFTNSKQDIGNAKSWSVVSGDLSGDGYIDIFIANGGNKVAVGDLNHDNLLDIIIVGNETTSIYSQTNNKK